MLNRNSLRAFLHRNDGDCKNFSVSHVQIIIQYSSIPNHRIRTKIVIYNLIFSRAILPKQMRCSWHILLGGKSINLTLHINLHKRIWSLFLLQNNCNPRVLCASDLAIISKTCVYFFSPSFSRNGGRDPGKAKAVSQLINKPLAKPFPSRVMWPQLNMQNDPK